METISNPWKTVKSTWDSSLLKKIQSFGKKELQSCLKKSQKGVEQKTMNMLSNKVLGKNEKSVFYFYFKTKGTY